jgi:ABC-type branched-subunit amino acid transport system substrate-binding protein
MKFFRRLMLTLALAAVCGPAAAPADEAPPGVRPNVFLLAAPLSGPLGEMGVKARQGAELALNTWGGGYTLEVLDETRPEALDDLDLGPVAAVLGYFTESRFAADAPRYLYLRKPVLLPYLSNEEAAGRGPGLFFRLMPTHQEQGRFLALEILGPRRRPSRILIIRGDGAAQGALVGALTETLVNPAPPAASPEEAPKSRPGRAEGDIRPLESKAQVVTISLDQALEPDGLVNFGRNRPDLVILAVDLPEALRLAPYLADGGYGKVPLWGGVNLGFREAGAAFLRLNLRLTLCLPTVNLADQQNPAVRDFTRQYIDAYQTAPTWVAALAFDSLNLAIKAASSGEDPRSVPDFLAGRSHHALAAYDLTPDGGGLSPLANMPVTPANLGYLP